MNVSPAVQLIVTSYRSLVLAENYYPQNPQDTVKARLCALVLLKDSDQNVAKAAETFLLKTSTNKQADLARLKEVASSMVSFDKFNILSSFERGGQDFLEYEIVYSTREKQGIRLHRHASYEMNEQGCCFVAQTAPLEEMSHQCHLAQVNKTTSPLVSKSIFTPEASLAPPIDAEPVKRP